MISFYENGIYLLLFFWMITTSWIIAYYMKKLSTDHPSDVSMIWYFYFLSLTISLMSIVFVIDQGWIDKQGHPSGYGNNFIQIVTFFLTIKKDFIFFTSLLGVVLLPEITSFIFSGFFGCAKKPRLLNLSFRIYIVSIIKVFITTAGITTALSLTTIFIMKEWLKLDQSFMLVITSLTSLMIASLLMTMYRELPIVSEQFISWVLRNKTVRKCLYKMTYYATKEERKEKMLQEKLILDGEKSIKFFTDRL